MDEIEEKIAEWEEMIHKQMTNQAVGGSVLKEFDKCIEQLKACRNTLSLVTRRYDQETIRRGKNDDSTSSIQSPKN